MGSKGAGFIGFVLGAAVGSVVTWYLVKTKYARVDLDGNISKEEIDSLKEALKKREEAKVVQEEKQELANEATHKPDIKEYAEMIKKNNYVNYSDRDPDKMDDNHQMKKAPRIEVISPSEFGENPEYDKVVLNYYSDSILADDMTGEEIEDYENLIGDDFMTFFGDYEPDTVFIRNDTEETYYEICRNERTYMEVDGRKPKPVEV